MAMNPMQKKARTSFLLGIFLTLIICGLVIVFLIFQLMQVKKEQESLVYKSVYVLSQDVQSGDYIGASYKKVEIDSSGVPKNAITDLSYLTDTTIAKVNLGQGTILTTDLIYEDGIEETSDVRVQEYNMLILPSQLEPGSYVDVRLRLPSGEDYIVISKKYVQDTDANTIWIKVSEDEILAMSNAIVEAYRMNGSLLYATTYSDAGIQNAASPTYVASSDVVQLMNSDPNITNVAKAALAERYASLQAQRQTIVNALNGFNEDGLTNVQQKVEIEIEEQQSARQQYIDGMAAPAE